jgi:hypothetical protein
MADVKISALPAATVALAGTEVLPIVQSSTTRQVSVANLTAGRAVSALSLTSTNDATISGLTVGKGGGAVSSNTAIGASALGVNTGGVQNTAVGNNALGANITNSANTAFGSDALRVATADDNTGIGGRALYTNTTGSQNTALGRLALYLNTTGSSNVASGTSALQANISGSFNTACGTNAGSLITSGSKNTILGGYNGNQDSLDIRTTSAYAVISDGDGNRQITMAEGQTLALDSAVPNSGTGITFPATQVPSANANTLDDYEEGVWTPIVEGSTTAGTATYGVQMGRYTKIGNTVRVYFAVNYTGHTGTGTTVVGGFPFTSNAGNQTPFSVFTYGETFTALNVANGGIMSNGSTQWLHWQVPVGGGISSGIPINAAAEIQVSGVYQTA